MDTIFCCLYLGFKMIFSSELFIINYLFMELYMPNPISNALVQQNRSSFNPTEQTVQSIFDKKISSFTKPLFVIIGILICAYLAVRFFNSRPARTQTSGGFISEQQAQELHKTRQLQKMYSHESSLLQTAITTENARTLCVYRRTLKQDIKELRAAIHYLCSKQDAQTELSSALSYFIKAYVWQCVGLPTDLTKVRSDHFNTQLLSHVNDMLSSLTRPGLTESEIDSTLNEVPTYWESFLREKLHTSSSIIHP